MALSQDLGKILKQYREAADKTSDPIPEKANVWARRLHKYYKQLCMSDEGRSGITKLLSDPSPHVRCWAASHSLKWEPRTARCVLEELRDAKGPCSFDAEITLEQFDKGKLSFDY